MEVISSCIVSISFFVSSHFSDCCRVSDSLNINSFSASNISLSKSLPSNLLRAPRKSDASSFANLNFLSNISKSRNFPRISFLFVEPSLINCNAPTWEDIDVIRKSSRVPKCFLIILSVSLRVNPFKLSVLSNTSS